MEKVYIQLYSVHEALGEDYDGTLKALSEMGYDGVEFANNYGDRSGGELNKTLEFYGLTPVSAHLSMDEIENNLQYHLDILEKTECRAIACSYAPMETDEDAADVGKRLKAAAEALAEKGFTLGYHNHAHEFKRGESGEYLLDTLFENAGPLVLAQLDLGWVAQAGADTEAMMRKYAGRVTFMHLKQFDSAGSSCLLEEGIVDYAKAIKTGALMGCEYFIVEQETRDGREVESAKANIDYLKKL